MPDRPDLNGFRIKHPNGTVYLILDGKRRHVPNPDTYNSLFRNWDGIITDVDVDSITDGGALSDGAVLAKPNNGPAVFLVSNNQKRHVTSPAVMDKYNFSWDRVVTVPHVLLDFIGTGNAIS
jgi:hypothetical protein